jgi:hypothetical protein
VEVLVTSRERVLRCLDLASPDRAPRDLWRLAGVEKLRAAELHDMLLRYPLDFEGSGPAYGPSHRKNGSPAEIGTYTDEWGCEWSVAEVGVCGEVKRAPLADWSALQDFAPPWEILDHADFAAVNSRCRSSDRFIRAGTEVRPFERMQFLRGTENLFVDLMVQPPELFRLRDSLHEFFLRELELWVHTDVDGIQIMDDWGAQGSLLIDPELWRAFFKPMYKDYCEIITSAGKRAFFHSDGFIREIIPDLIEIGVDALNCQLFCMDIEEIGQKFQGKITFWGEICRQRILPFGTVDDVRAAVRRVRAALDHGTGGVIAQCEWGNRDPAENIAAVFETWME